VGNALTVAASPESSATTARDANAPSQPLHRHAGYTVPGQNAPEVSVPSVIPEAAALPCFPPKSSEIAPARCE